ncbi:helix-turn-helix transcriptional regulator [Peribacillus simplex]|uniref:Helix-turn-helix transcriptional regulator n=2 Tax=Peribacillus TaxID=2675229 RepID=A0AA90PH31_9BACI|nr:MULTISPECIES: helix-turn-helix transcriptional regulator [Peribacillus]MDP1419207.1 helix-turn-helix transcriptional regulator [Peribacillus simplex]MDP1452155.1 helix-turn-helix transcriptional regulator [Peribacillus frigoritolerans]
MKIVLRVRLDEILKERNMTQKELVELIKEKLDKDVRTASISELYNNQRKSLNKELIENIASALEISNINEFITFDVK